MKVWGIGLGRTGTRTLLRMLDNIGLKTIHCPPNIESLKGYNAAAEGCCMYSYKFLDLRYSDSKFILTTRDIDSWIASCKKAMIKYPASRLSKESPYYDYMIANRAARYGCIDFDEARLRKNYEWHHSSVLDYFAGKSNILLLEVGKFSYGEICKFLRLPEVSLEIPYIRDCDES